MAAKWDVRVDDAAFQRWVNGASTEDTDAIRQWIEECRSSGPPPKVKLVESNGEGSYRCVVGQMILVEFHYAFSGASFPKLQILSVADLLKGAKVQMPTPISPYRKAKAVSGQLDLDLDLDLVGEV